MTTAEIETRADIGGLSHPDIDLKVLLRRNCVPAFLADVGYTSWRRKILNIPLAVGEKQKDLPDDFWQMQVMHLTTDMNSEIQYIGEDPDKMLVAEVNVTPGKPSGYYLKPRATGGLLWSVAFNSPADTAYTAICTYYSNVFFADDTSVVDMNKYIPHQFQWGLVEKLRCEIYVLRFGIGDPRYVVAEQQYETWVGRATENKELARRHTPVFVR